jgi:hypothetical protein
VLLSGGLMLGAVFMATDMATSPVTPKGVWIYGALIGVVTVMIRYFGGLTEGVMYAILIGNALAPLIDQVTQPKVFRPDHGKKPRRRKRHERSRPATRHPQRRHDPHPGHRRHRMRRAHRHRLRRHPGRRSTPTRSSPWNGPCSRSFPGAAKVDEYVARGGIQPAGARSRKGR